MLNEWDLNSDWMDEIIGCLHRTTRKVDRVCFSNNYLKNFIWAHCKAFTLLLTLHPTII